MKLFLCGGGSGKQINFALNKFSKLIDKNKPILYIPLAMNDDDYDNCESWFSSEINFLMNYHKKISTIILLYL